MRLDKFLVSTGKISRSDAGRAARGGKITVNGVVEKKADRHIDPETDAVTLNGERIVYRQYTYIMLNKPKGVVSATRDPAKKTVIDIIPDELKRRSLFPAGRLDRDTVGLLIITDDGAFAHRIMSPAHHVFKTYEATLSFPIDENDIRKLEEGITLGDGTECLPAKVKAFTTNEGLPAAQIKIREGKYHQVKRMFHALGNNVEHLRRIQIGSLKLDTSLAEGECREMTDEELELVFLDEN